METAAPKRRVAFLRQSSLAPPGRSPQGLSKEESKELLTAEQLDVTLQLLYFAAKGKLDGVQEILKRNINLDSVDYDQRTALHVASCEDKIEVVKLLLNKGASVNAEDRWGSTPLADAQHYGNVEICHILEQHGGQLGKSSRNSLMRMTSSLVPEYEIDHSILNFNVEQPSKKGDLYRIAIWQGTKVFVKFLPGINIAADDDVVRSFKDELALLLKLRHPNVVQFLGAVTQTSPMMIITEFLPGGNLQNYMEERNRRLEMPTAVAFALDVARGLNYLHEHKPESIIHCDLKPTNLLLSDTSGHIKVANFGLSHSMHGEKSGESSVSTKHQGSVCRYMAPEIFEHTVYDKSGDVFAFALILQEMLEGHRPFPEMDSDADVAKAYVAGERPPFKHSGRHYSHLVKELIEECWDAEPSKRPHFGNIIQRLESIQKSTNWKCKLKSLFIGQ